MSIGPVDFNLMLNQTTNVTKVNDEGYRNNEQQMAFAEHMKQEVEHEQQKTVQSKETQEHTVKDGQGGNKGQYKDSKRKKEEEEEPIKKNKNSSSIFDVSI